MARAKKEQKAEDGRSVLRLAFEAYERGDVVQARSLAGDVLAGKVGRDDAKAAVDIAKALSVTAQPDMKGEGVVLIAETPEAVAREIQARTGVPPRAYLFVGAAAAAFLMLVLIARFRY